MSMQEKEWEKIEGQVTAVIYANQDSGYTVLRLTLDDESETVVVGCIPMAVPGESLTVWGTWTRHPTHGEQFKAEHAERRMPTGAAAIFRYLSGHAVKGVGSATAAAIVGRFGDESLHVLRDKPDLLATLPGISRKKAQELSNTFRRETDMRALMEYVADAGLAPVLALRLYRCYGVEALDKLQGNPYVLCSEQVGASFSEADALALANGTETDDPQRIAAAIVFELQHNENNGHCFLPADKLIAATAKLIEVDPKQVGEGLEILLDAGDVIQEPVGNVTACYLSSLYAAETYVAQRLREMAQRTYENKGVSVERVIEKIEAEQKITFAPLQRQTLTAAADRQIFVITGGPGTGKTTAVRAVLAFFDAMGRKTMLAAPTGQAAKRLSDVTGRDASTIHRLLEASFSPETGSTVFSKDANHPLKCDALVLDECSMIDITLMQAVLAAVGADCRLVLVGDADQLPSVGPGCVFRDIIRSGVVHTVRLTEIFRQKDESRIVVNAHAINRGIVPDLRCNKDGFYFMRRTDPDQTAELIVSLCRERLPQNMGIPSGQIQILTPTRKGTTGTEELNKRLQQALNPPSTTRQEFTYADRVFREGDRVMQTRNDYDIAWVTSSMERGLGVFNGDIGYISKIDPASQSFTIDFDDRVAEYVFEQAVEIEHAWAITVHKSQGSEYRAVIMAAVSVPPSLRYRSILYTGVTRAEELFILAGDEAMVSTMTENGRRNKRYSGLCVRMIRDEQR